MFMKKDRNCGATPYPIYPAYQGMMIPPMGMPMANPYQGYQNIVSTNAVSTNTIEQQINTLENKITSLENRITNLENMINNSNSVLYSNNKYSSSNYQMM